MANDPTLPVRRAGLDALKGSEALTALIAAASIHPQAPLSEPSWPFVKWGTPSAIPLIATCIDGAEIVVAVHGFSKGRWDGADLVETAEDHAARIGKAIAVALGGLRVDLDGGGHALFRWTGSQLLVDAGETDAFHTVQNFQVRVIA